MKKFYKSTLCIALICCVLGLGLVIVGAVQGGSRLFLNMVKNNEFVFGDNNMHSLYWTDGNEKYEKKEYYFKKEEIDKLKLDVGVSILEIKYEDTEQYHIKMQQTSEGHGSCSVKDGVLYLESGMEDHVIQFGIAKTKPNKITITIPKQDNIKEFELVLGAGSCKGKELMADDIRIEVGAGNLELDKLKAERTLNVLVGAGNMETDNIQARQLEVEVGVGRYFADNVLATESIDVTCDAGYVCMDMEDEENSYNYDLVGSIGSIKLKDGQYRGVDFSKKIDNDAQKNFTIECNVGSIEIDFNK